MLPDVSSHLGLHHGGALRAQRARGLEHVHDALVLHALQHRGQRDEHARAPHARAAHGTNVYTTVAFQSNLRVT